MKYDPNIFAHYWIFKYAPSSFEEMVLPVDVREKLDEFVKNGEFQTLLLAGKPGQGKTTLARLLAKKFSSSVKFINASSENGVNMVRNLAEFVETMSLDGSLKVVILDEADRLSKEAQDALRGMIESSAQHTRFILTANEIARITDALQSRCIQFQMTPPKNEFYKFIINIIKQENIKLENSKEEFITFLDSLYPDIRRTINCLQKNTKNGVLNIENINMNEIFAYSLVESMRTMDNISIREQWIKQEKEFNSDYQSLLKSIHEVIFNLDDELISMANKARCLLIISDALKDSTIVVDQEINFYACINRIMSVIND